ncbi:MAG: hypothetical protein ACI4HQ_14580 [Acetatifactor sp.]
MTQLDFVLSFLLTLLLEGLVAFVWRFRGRDRLLFVLANLLTNPMVVLLHAMFPGWGILLGLELGAIVTEGICYERLGTDIRHPRCFSVAANVFSFCMGLVIDRLI